MHLDEDTLTAVAKVARYVTERGHEFWSFQLGFHGISPEKFTKTQNVCGGHDIVARCAKCGAKLLVRTGTHPTTLGLACTTTCQECQEDETMKYLAQGSVVIMLTAV